MAARCGPAALAIVSAENVGGEVTMRRGLVLLTALLAVGPGLAALAAGSGNATNDQLLALPPDQQAAMLTKGIKGCAGTSAFPMGVTTAGKAKGYAYWSVH